MLYWPVPIPTWARVWTWLISCCFALRSVLVCGCVQALQGILKRHHVQLRYKDSDPFVPSTGGTCLHPCCPSAATEAPPEPTPPGDADVAINFAEIENDDWQQALWADAHAVHHAAQAAD